jgi:hypothetical protein
MVLNNHTKQLRSKNSAQFCVVRPIHAAPAIPAYHQRPFAYMWPFIGQTAENRAKPSTPLHSPYDFGAHRRSGITNGPSRRTTSYHEKPAYWLLVLVQAPRWGVSRTRGAVWGPQIGTIWTTTTTALGLYGRCVVERWAPGNGSYSRVPPRARQKLCTGLRAC